MSEKASTAFGQYYNNLSRVRRIQVLQAFRARGITAQRIHAWRNLGCVPSPKIWTVVEKIMDQPIEELFPQK